MESTPSTYKIGDWAFSSIHGASVRVLDFETVWGRSVYQVWVPRLGAMKRVPAESLSAGQANDQAKLDRILYAISAAKIADALTQDVLLAPLEEGFIQDEQGIWLVPDPNKEADLEQLRHRSLLKECQRYQDVKGKLKVFRTEALRAGFKDAWQRQDYATIVQMAKRVSESVVQEDPALLMYFDAALMRVGEGK
jgi:hypothetical protein